MMARQFIEAVKQDAVYNLKEGTQSSYYHTSGARILPKRLSISRESEMTKVAKAGRNLLHPVIGQLIGRFTREETSPLKRYKPFFCRTQIWQVPEYPLFIGYGSIGISNNEGKINRASDTGDLVVLTASDRDWRTLRIYYFPAMIHQLDAVMQYLSEG
jgi:hypothetical protein